MTKKIILHADVNNFYASVAIRLNPNLKGREVVVCGDVERRHGIVLAKSNEAKLKGVKTGDTLADVRRKCPNAIFVPPDYKQYKLFSDKIYNIYKNFTPLVESFGLDECWLDVTNVQKIYGCGEDIAYKIKDEVKLQTGLTISIGVSFTKIFAKLGSDLKKPDAVSIISEENYKRVAWSLAVSDMLYVGKKMEKKLNTLNIFTIGDLANYEKSILIKEFGKVGEKLYLSSNGIEIDEVSEYNINVIPESVSNGTTTDVDIDTRKFATSVIYSLCEVIATRLRRYHLTASGISLSYKFNNLSSFSRQLKLSVNTNDAQVIAENALVILDKYYSFGEDLPLRAITVGTYGLKSVDYGQQLNFYDDTFQKNINIDEKLDKIRDKYGFGILKRAIEINPLFQCDTKEIEDGFLPFDKSKNNLDDES